MCAHTTSKWVAFLANFLLNLSHLALVANRGPSLRSHSTRP